MMKRAAQANRRSTTAVVALVSLLIPAVQLAAPIASATQAGPGGVNVGFDFSWSESTNPLGHTASFLEADGLRVNNCAPSQNNLATTRTCNFAFEYDVNGSTRQRVSHSARYIRWSNPTSYSGGQPVTGSGCNSASPEAGDTGKAPLTLFDCFNTGSFGQIFQPDTTGPLTQFRMPMTCLAPSGIDRYEMYALLYEMSGDGRTIVSTSPLGATLVNLSQCPTATTWNNKTFTSSSFRLIPMTFADPQVVAGRFYGLYFTGTGVPGTLPPGASAAMAAAKAASTTTTTTTTTTPWSSFRNETTQAAPAATPSGPVFTALGSSQVAGSAIRLMTSAQNRTYYINSLTPKVCLGSDRFLIFVKKGRCRVQAQVRRNGRVAATLTTRVVNGTVVESDVVSAVAKPTRLYFANGTNRLTSASRRRLNAMMGRARAASSILVAGHTGNLSGESSNLVALSERRAKSVRSLMRGRGARQTIAIWSFGASNPVTKSKVARKQAKNRRVEVFLVP